MEPQLLCLRWNNHQSNLVTVFDQLLQNEAFCDVTLAVEGKTVKCHQMVMAAASPYFQSIFMEKPCPHPIVFLKDITYAQLRHLLEYIYYGEASVHEDELQGLLKIAENLKIKGLVEIEEETINKQTPDRGSLPESRSNVPNSSGKASIWPSSPAKLMNQPRERSDEDGVLVIDEESNGSAPTTSPMEAKYPDYGNYLDEKPPAPGMVMVVGANGKAEWKRYKQYTKDDIVAAIEEVKNGMSALQASRKYGVPSRTLYDKVKKMGILTANMQKQIQQKHQSPKNDGAPINMLGMQLPQANLPNASQQQAAGQAADSATPPLPGSLMMSVMSMMTEKLNNINNQGAPVSLSNLLRHSSQLANSREGSDSGHSSSDLGEGESTVKEESPEETQKDPQQLTPAYLLSHLVNMRRGENIINNINQSNGVNGTAQHHVTLTPREENLSPRDPNAAPRDQNAAQDTQSLKRKSADPDPEAQISGCKKSLVEEPKAGAWASEEPIKQEQESI